MEDLHKINLHNKLQIKLSEGLIVSIQLDVDDSKVQYN